VKNAHRLLVGKEGERKRSLGRPRDMWMNNIKMNLEEVEWGGGDNWLDWSGSGQGQVENSCDYSNELSGSMK
jgi:hypothetical protein